MIIMLLTVNNYTHSFHKKLLALVFVNLFVNGKSYD